MFLRFDESAPFGFVDDRVFTEESSPREVKEVLRLRDGQEVWCRIEGLTEKGASVPAMACRVQDSGEGTCTLVYGGLWGVRLIDAQGKQWNEPFLLLPATGEDVR